MNEESLYQSNSLFSRRDFMRMSNRACAGVGLSSMANTILHQKTLAAISDATNVGQDYSYKALVCVFLYGGNDGMNCFLPYPESSSGFSNIYSRLRNEVAIPEAELQDTIAATRVTNGSFNNERFAFHPELSFFRDAFDAGNMAVVSNVGTLVQPVTRAQFLNPASGVPVPPQLFSHSDQQVQWQTSLPGQDSSTGWGGRLGDAARQFNENSRVSISVSVGRSNILTVGNQISRLDLGGGAVRLSTSGPDGLLQAAEDIRNLNKKHVFEKEFANITKRSISAEALLGSIINRTPGPDQVGGAFQERDNDILFQQFRSVSQMIAARQELGVNRQIFFVSYPNFDTHGSQLTGQATQLNAVNRAMQLFCDEMESLGLSKNVTTFTVSDFGRSYTSNANGTDHGWGNNHFVIGGDVKGGEVYGRLPDFQLDGDDDTGNGRWIPAVASDEYISTFAKWFGVADSDIPSVVPFIDRFNTRDLGFFNPAS